MATLAQVLLVVAAMGLVVIAAQHLVLRRHVRQAPPVPRRTPPISPARVEGTRIELPGAASEISPEASDEAAALL